MNSPARQQHLQPFFEQQLPIHTQDHRRLARVTAHYGSHVLLQTVDREFQLPVSQMALAQSAATGYPAAVAVGDWVWLDPELQLVELYLERKSCLYRKAAGERVQTQLIAANVDTVFLVSSCNQDFNPSRLERYLALILDSGATPVVVLTKSDLCDDPCRLLQTATALKPGLIVETLDARDAGQVSVLEPWCGPGKTVAMLGSSGVGKSTLANTLCGTAIHTASIREDDAKGRHTTTARHLHLMKSGGWLIDTPGMRELQLPGCESGIQDLFQDVMHWAESCRFRDCRHQGDHGCAVRQAVEDGILDERRVRSFLKLQREQSRNQDTLAERRRRERQTGKMYKSIMAEKKKRR